MSNYILHKLPEGFIVTSDEEPKLGKVYDSDVNCILEFTPYDKTTCFYKKIIAQQDQLDFSALSKEEHKEIGWVDVDKLSTEYADFNYANRGEYIAQNYASNHSFKAGFQKAQELLSDRRFTLEDIAFAFRAGIEHGINPKKLNTTEYIKSLSQPKSWKVVGNWENNKFKITKIQ